MATPDRDALWKTIISRATVDPAFRAQLVADPGGAFVTATGAPLPDDFRIRFIEKDPGVDMLIVLPDLVPADPELSVEELEQVAGGTAWCDTITNDDYTGGGC
jgi:hypothetical protein